MVITPGAFGAERKILGIYCSQCNLEISISNIVYEAKAERNKNSSTRTNDGDKFT